MLEVLDKVTLTSGVVAVTPVVFVSRLALVLWVLGTVLWVVWDHFADKRGKTHILKDEDVDRIAKAVHDRMKEDA